MIHHIQPALNKLLVVGGNGFIGLLFLRLRVSRVKLNINSGSAVCRAALRHGYQVNSIR